MVYSTWDGFLADEFEAASSTNFIATIDNIVSKVLEPNCTCHRWASLGSRLPLLAEASPNFFLNVVQTNLKKSTPQLYETLKDEGDTLFCRCNHAELLWALEVSRLTPEQSWHHEQSFNYLDNNIDELC